MKIKSKNLGVFYTPKFLKDEIRILKSRIRETKDKVAKEKLKKIMIPLKRELYLQTGSSEC